MMTRFQEILNESKKTYNFKIGVAGDLPEGCEENMRTSLKKFDITEMSKGKRTPVQERPLDFPTLENMNVTYFDVALNYPTTAPVLAEYISQCCNIHTSHLVVKNEGNMSDVYQAIPEDTTYETMLTTEDMGGESAQKDVGENRVMDLLKELEVARKEREHDPSAAAPEAN
jgi:hypothetical protein